MYELCIWNVLFSCKDSTYRNMKNAYEELIGLFNLIKYKILKVPKIECKRGIVLSKAHSEPTAPHITTKRIQL